MTTPTPTPDTPGWAVAVAVLGAVLGTAGLVLGSHALALVAAVAGTTCIAVTARVIIRARTTPPTRPARTEEDR